MPLGRVCPGGNHAVGTVSLSTSLSSNDEIAASSAGQIRGLPKRVTNTESSIGPRAALSEVGMVVSGVAKRPVTSRRKGPVGTRRFVRVTRSATRLTVAGSTAAHLTLMPVASEPRLHVISTYEPIPALAIVDIAALKVAAGNRAMNVCMAGLALVLTSPLIILIAVAIKLTSRGPVLYLQERVGLDRRRFTVHEVDRRRTQDIGGKPFVIYKFRSMRDDAERESGAIWAAKDDPRVTSVGRFLRRYRLDELPQLLNVLRGEMNIVGPRPERPTIFADLRQHIPEYPLRQRAKPGITGLAQINHHYDRTLEDVHIKLRYDLEYITRQSVLQDVRIIISTLPAVVLGRGGW